MQGKRLVPTVHNSLMDRQPQHDISSRAALRLGARLNPGRENHGTQKFEWRRRSAQIPGRRGNRRSRNRDPHRQERGEPPTPIRPPPSSSVPPPRPPKLNSARQAWRQVQARSPVRRDRLHGRRPQIARHRFRVQQPASSCRGIHESIVNYGGNKKPNSSPACTKNPRSP